MKSVLFIQEDQLGVSLLTYEQVSNEQIRQKLEQQAKHMEIEMD
jgi:hypothetical protein